MNISLPVHHQLPEFTQTHIESVMPSNHLILCRPLLLRPSFFPRIKVFSNESALLIRWPKYWSFSFNISPSNEHPGLISFRMDRLDLLEVQETLKSLLQHHSSKASIFLCSAFFTVQLSHPLVTTGKTIALTRWTFVGKVMSLLFNMLSRLVITFLPRSKRLLISWLQSPSAVILEPKKIKSVTVSTVVLSHCIIIICNDPETCWNKTIPIGTMCLVAQSCPTLCDPIDCSLSGSSVNRDSPGKNTGVGCHALLQWISQPRDQTQVS